MAPRRNSQTVAAENDLLSLPGQQLGQNKRYIDVVVCKVQGWAMKREDFKP